MTNPTVHQTPIFISMEYKVASVRTKSGWSGMRAKENTVKGTKANAVALKMSPKKFLLRQTGRSSTNSIGTSRKTEKTT